MMERFENPLAGKPAETSIRLVNARYRVWRLGLPLAYVAMQAAALYLYWSPPASAHHWTVLLTNVLPWIGGLAYPDAISKLDGRLSFVFAISYLPMAALGILAVHWEFFVKTKPSSVKGGKLRNLAAALLGAVIIFSFHFFAYWYKATSGFRFNLMHPVLAVAVPYALGAFVYIEILVLKKLFFRKREQ